jgi:hypothetical protein
LVRSIPGIEQTESPPSKDDLLGATNFLSHISLVVQAKLAYQSDLHNMADDFLLLRFGKIIGSRASPTTAQLSKQFIYLVDRFLRSVSDLFVMLCSSSNEHDELASLVSMFAVNSCAMPIDSTIVRLSNETIFSPRVHVDQWTWLVEKWRDALRTFPMRLTEVGAFTRLLRTTIGIGIARLFSFAEIMIESKQTIDAATLDEQLFHALQMGFYFGVAYAIVDCLQDEIHRVDPQTVNHYVEQYLQAQSCSRTSTATEIVDHWLKIMERFLIGDEFDRTLLPRTPLTPLLIETYDSLRCLTERMHGTSIVFNELALLLRSQRIDKKTFEPNNDDQQLLFVGKNIDQRRVEQYGSRCCMSNRSLTQRERERERESSIREQRITRQVSIDSHVRCFMSIF